MKKSEKFLRQRKYGFKENTPGGGGGEEQPLHKKSFHEAASIRALTSENRHRLLQASSPQLGGAAVSLRVPAPGSCSFSPWDAAAYEPYLTKTAKQSVSSERSEGSERLHPTAR